MLRPSTLILQDARLAIRMKESLPSQFASTQWSMVLRAGDANHVDAQRSLAELCERYWYPLYVFVRRRIASPEDAQDLTQEFFSRLIERNVVSQASPERGRFRSFLLASIQNFLSNARDHDHAQK